MITSKNKLIKLSNWLKKVSKNVFTIILFAIWKKKHYAVMSTPSAIFSLYHIYSARKNIRTIISVWTASE